MAAGTGTEATGTVAVGTGTAAARTGTAAGPDSCEAAASGTSGTAPVGLITPPEVATTAGASGAVSSSESMMIVSCWDTLGYFTLTGQIYCWIVLRLTYDRTTLKFELNWSSSATSTPSIRLRATFVKQK